MRTMRLTSLNEFLRIHRSTLVNFDWIKEVASFPGSFACTSQGWQGNEPVCCARARVQGAGGMLVFCPAYNWQSLEGG